MPAPTSTPAIKSSVIAKSDTVDLVPRPKALWINTAGVIRGFLAGDYGAAGADPAPKDYTVGAGACPLSFRRIYNTGTTAAMIGIVE